MGKKLLDITNKKFGRLTLIKPIEVRPRKWLCKCDCGKEKEILQTHIIQGNINSCGCLKSGAFNIGWKGYGEISGDRFRELQRYRNKKLEFKVTIQELWELFLKQNRKCALSGIDIYFGKEKTASLDRIDSSKGYFLDNVQWVHKKINIMKNIYSQQKFIEMCKLVTHPLKIENKEFIIQTNFSQRKWSDINRAKFRGIELKITKEDILNMFNEQKGICNMTGLPIILNIYGPDPYANIASLDRIDSSKGYIIGNLQWIHKVINKMKHTLSIDDFKYFCKKVSENA